MTLERPMFPPRAEFQDSFSHHHPPGDSSKPAKGHFGGSVKPWTEEETTLARRMLAEGKSDPEFHRVLGRSKGQARLRLYRLHFPTKGWDWLELPKERHADVPADVWAQANHRINAPRTLSAWICGDPAPGYSALDQRTGREAQQ